MATFAIHNTVRSRGNRTLRAAQPVHHRFKQYLGDGQRRLIRGRPLFMEEEELVRHRDDLKAKAAAGILEVRTLEGLLVDLDTLKPEAALPSPPLPNVRPDSIANDVPWGQVIPPMAGDEPVPDDPKEPTLLSELEESEEEDPTDPPLDETAHAARSHHKAPRKGKR